MKKLPIPKETKRKLTVWDQLQMGLICYMFGLFLTTISENQLYQIIGNCIYWSIFVINPAVPVSFQDNPEKVRRYKLSMRAVSLVMILYPFNQLFQLH